LVFRESVPVPDLARILERLRVQQQTHPRVVPQLTTVVGLAFDQRERLYILEMSPATGGPMPGNGKIVRYEYNGQLTDIATGLTFPTAMTFRPDGLLYVSHKGFGFPPGAGEIVTVSITN
jgi:hypothetical protein